MSPPRRYRAWPVRIRPSLLPALNSLSRPLTICMECRACINSSANESGPGSRWSAPWLRSMPRSGLRTFILNPSQSIDDRVPGLQGHRPSAIAHLAPFALISPIWPRNFSAASASSPSAAAPATNIAGFARVSMKFACAKTASTIAGPAAKRAICRHNMEPRARSGRRVIEYYKSLLSRYGPQNWWPAQSRFEVIMGAYLTQNTNWGNVEKAMSNLRRARALGLKALRELPLRKLEELVRPSGYFRQKARKLKIFIDFLDRKYSGSLDRMFSQPTDKLRAELLELNGVGPETADSILLYAGNHPVFVVDAYTRRVLERHGIITAPTG